ncbi:MAG: hypothetical protein K2Y23_08950 [Cyanobacteria bacterium]|nr:hypothetical protein [Cyanobacteriota bacterium]
MTKLVTASASATSAADAVRVLLPWANGEALHPAEVRGRIMRFLTTPIEEGDLVVGLTADEGERLAAGVISDARLRRLHQEFQELLADASATQSRKWPKKLWRFPTLSYGRVIVTHDRKDVFVNWISGELRDLLLYTTWHLLTKAKPVALARCSAPAPGDWSKTCGNWLVKQGGRRGPSATRCSATCRQRVNRKKKADDVKANRRRA